ncbi:twin-arginine translocase TatA/TatE family subunit [Actinomyces howellii]|uniref:twin-arginine translocase TatA/TatE family subunit n=1 Tax=Actinomyces howellii TaxID=52771 RepID=UPI000F8465BF|nr:twin-arginine translocase TatA/TatE family subunit [Actinomyces howellii]
MFGISGAEFFVIVLVAVLVVGPQRLPEYTRKLTQAVRRLRVFLDDAKVQIAEEVGPELGDLDLSDLDPRNYDPRKIVRDALGEDLDAIRRDLANPFQSVAKTVKETSDDAVAAAAGARGSKSLSTMINDKAEETRRANASRQAAAAARQDETPESSEPSETTEAPGTSEEPGTDPVEGTTGTEAAEAAEATEAADATEAAEAAEATTDPGSTSGPDLVRAEAEAQAVTAEIPEVEQAGTVEVSDNAGPEEPEASDGPADPAAVPSSLSEDDARAPEPVRPISPRDIVRAARAAARTRAEAAEAVVEV